MTDAATRALTGLLILLATASSGFAQQQFAEAESAYIPLRRDPGFDVAAADVDGDGKLDIYVGSSSVVSGWQDRLYLGNGVGEFRDVTNTNLPRGLHRTNSVAFGDIDGDGDVDLVTADDYQNRLYLNDGSGKFSDVTFGRLPSDLDDCRTVLMLDADGDGDLDLFFAAYRQELLYLNDGTGTFSDVTATHMAANATSTWGADAGDVDGDGDVDIILAEQRGQALLVNDGAGRFTNVTAAQFPTTTEFCRAIGFGDFDNDGDLDVLSGHYGSAPDLFLNDGAGTFTLSAGLITTTMDSITGVVIGDLTGDGKPDVMVHGWRAHETPGWDLLHNDGTGKLASVTTTHVASTAAPYIRNATLADVDADGDLDYIAAGYWQRDLILLNEGDGTMVDVTPTRLDGVMNIPWDAVVEDLDGDGDRDVVFANGFYEWQSWPNRFYQNDGHGTFVDVTGTRMPKENDNSHAVAAGDVDADGDVDLVFGNEGQNSMFLNDGTGNFTIAPANRLPAATNTTRAIELVDVNGDGHLDIVAGNFGEQCTLALNDGAGTFTDVTATNLPVFVHETRDLAVGDITGDGHPDIVVAVGFVSGAQNRLLVNDGTGKFTDATATHMPTARNTSSCVALGDMDGDGDLDAVFGNDALTGGSPMNRLYRNDGGTLRLAWLLYDFENTTSVALLDADGDGDLDVAVGNSDFYNKLYLNTGNAVFIDGTTRMPARFEGTRVLVAGDLDGDGDPDLVAGNASQLQIESAVHINRLRQIRATRPPHTGENWRIEVFSRAGHATEPQVATLVVGLSSATIPLPPMGTLGVDPNSMVILPPIALQAPSGTGSNYLPIPAVASLAGLRLFVQAGVAPSAAPSAIRFTNVLRGRIGGF